MTLSVRAPSYFLGSLMLAILFGWGQTMGDQKLADVAGPYQVSLGMSGQETERIIAAVRGFIWQHWHMGRAGRVQLTRFSIEGEPSTWMYGVERNASGRLRVSVRVVRKLLDRRTMSHYEETKTYVFYHLQRVESRKDEAKTEARIPDAADRPPGEFRLLFQDEQHRTVLTL